MAKKQVSRRQFYSQEALDLRRSAHTARQTDGRSARLAQLLAAPDSPLDVELLLAAETEIAADQRAKERAEIEAREAIFAEIGKYLDALKQTGETKGFVYVIQIKRQKAYKIGAATNVERRVKELQVYCPWELVVVLSIPCQDPYWLESHLHLMFEHKQMRGEWFKLDRNDLLTIKSLARTAP